MTDVTTEQPTVEEVALAQRAVDPRAEQQVADAVAEPNAEETVGDQTTQAEPTAEEVPPPKPKKTTEEVLKGRVGHLTKTLSAKDRELEEARARAEAAEALLAGNRGTVGDGNEPVVSPPLGTAKQYTQADFEAAVAAQTAIQEFNRKADDMYNDGATKFQDWKDSVDTLVVSGFMNKDLLDAAMAIEDGAAVLHHLGSNLDEAERINALPPIRKAAEMAKLSATLNAPRVVPVSSAPAPIRPVSGSPNPSVDLQRIADTDDMSAYLAARAKQGSRWAKARS